MTRIPNTEVVPQIISELVELEPEIVAIGAVMVMKDGSLKTKLAYMEGTRLMLLSGVRLFEHDFLHDISSTPGGTARIA